MSSLAPPEFQNSDKKCRLHIYLETKIMQFVRNAEFEFWQRFSDVEIKSDDGNDEGSTASVNSFSVCNHCGMYIKTQSYAGHLKRRHDFGPMSDVAMLLELTTDDEPTIAQSAKRRKTDNEEMTHNMEMNPKTVIKTELSHSTSVEHSKPQQEPKSALRKTHCQQTKLADNSQGNVMSPSGFMRPRPVVQARRHYIVQKKMPTVSSLANSISQIELSEQAKASEPLQAHHSFPSQQIKPVNPLRIKIKRSHLGSWQVVTA